MDDHYGHGFTLVELLIALTILVILITGAIPAMSDVVERQRLYNAAETIAADLRMVRNEALSRDSDEMVVSFQPGSDWCYGVAATACDCHALIDEADSCTLARNRALHHFTRHATEFSHITLTNAGFLRGARVGFDAVRGLSQPGTITIASRSGKQLAIKVSLMGRVRICAPTDAGGLRYPAC